MSRILLIETSTSRCSAALVDGGTVTAHRQTEEPRAHASQLCPFVDGMLKEGSMTLQDLDAVAVSGGPGSYTGLRVGVSTAKGFCFGGDKPLISVGTLDILAWQAIGTRELPHGAIIIPMVDARRMEVYTQLFSSVGEPLSECESKVLDVCSFDDLSASGNLLVFVGDGVGKYRRLLEEQAPRKVEDSIFMECCPDACAMAVPASRRFDAGQFESSAYYEPFYLKEFVTGISRKSVL